MRVYIAAGWFTPDQETKRLDIIEALGKAGVSYYSPKDDGLYVPGKTSGSQILLDNIIQIELSDVVIASTEGKDMGTLWECGYAYALKVPVVYYWVGTGKFNLMLAESGDAVCTSKEDLIDYVQKSSDLGYPVIRKFKGEME